ncbi:hypothetical protein V6N12_042928 [Hibiscus sabdariffa]|uniref:Uncharacterized protein n=1 Tax=Hibiscus sabdariffa TaxID=183260 RepID=A0ABR2BFE8_9ROSI
MVETVAGAPVGGGDHGGVRGGPRQHRWQHCWLAKELIEFSDLWRKEEEMRRTEIRWVITLLIKPVWFTVHPNRNQPSFQCPGSGPNRTRGRPAKATQLLGSADSMARLA